VGSSRTEPTGSGLSADGYARIDDPPRRPQPNYSGADFYDVIRDDVSVTASSDFDPNYESVAQVVTTAVSSSAVQPPDNAVTMSSGADQSMQRNLLIREHIYDEVTLPAERTSGTVRHSDV